MPRTEVRSDDTFESEEWWPVARPTAGARVRRAARGVCWIAAGLAALGLFGVMIGAELAPYHTGLVLDDFRCDVLSDGGCRARSVDWYDPQ